MVQLVPGYLLGTLGIVPRAYENEELPEKKYLVWCTSFLIYMKRKMTK